ncbi:MAG: amidohydrolase [Halopenitus sp.]
METLAITGGRVLHPDGRVTESDVLVDRESGTIEAVGPDLEGDETLDADGGLVMPGLVNAHTHVAMSLLRGYADDKELDAWLQEDIWPIEAELTPDDIEVGAELGVLEMIKSGTTAFADMYFHVDHIAEVVDRAGVRARLGHGIVTVGKDEEDARADVEEGIEVATSLDGAAEGRVRTAFMPHSLTTVSEELLAEGLDLASAHDVPVHLHANETEDEVTPIVDEHDERPMAYAEALGALGEGNFFAHGVHLDDTEIGLLAETDTSIIHCPASNMKLASGIAPVQRLHDAGVTVGLGTDGPASNNDLDLFDEMRDAAMVGKLGADDASAVPAGDVVEMATAGGAEAIGLPGGRVEPGAAADLVVVDLDAPHLTPVHNVVSHLAYAARGSDVRHTVCDGEVLMRDREVLPLDAEAVKARAAEHAADLVDRVGE